MSPGHEDGASGQRRRTVEDTSVFMVTLDAGVAA